MIQAKFRCLEVTETYKGEISVKLAPVIPKNDTYPGGSEENRKFWEASPSGECLLYFQTKAACFVEVGSYYLIDMIPDEKGEWKLGELGYMGETTLSVHFDRGMWSTPFPRGTLKIGIHNKKAWPAFEGMAGTKWNIFFSESDVQNPGCPYTG